MTLPFNDWMKLFWYTSKPLWVVYALQGALFGLLFWLSKGSFSIYLYGMQLSLFFVVIYGIVRTYQHRLQLQRVTVHSAKDARHRDPVTEAYRQELLKRDTELKQFIQQTEEKQEDQLAYFTLWLHQIKTPLSALHLLNQASESAQKKQTAQELLRMDEYTSMVLNYIKLEDVGKEMDISHVNLDTLIRTVVKKYSILFIHKRISLHYDSIDTLVVSDAKWLQVLLEQIISNSLKYTQEGTITITFNEDQHALVIEDTGIGIRAEDLPRIFAKGYSGLNGKLYEKSTGLGLFLGKRIADRLGHTLSVESEMGKGTTVYIQFKQENLAIFD